MKFNVNFSPLMARYEFFIRDHSGNIVSNVQFVQDENQDLGHYRNPSMALDEDDAQALLQVLWNAGLRPNNGESTVAHVGALKQHLEDMRKFADRGFTALEKLTEK